MNKGKENNKIEQLVQDYLRGKLDPQQTDELWALLLENPEHLDYMKTLLAIHNMADEAALNPEQRFGTAVNTSWRAYLTAAAVLLILGLVGMLYFVSPQETDQPVPLATIELDNVRSAAGLTGSETLLQAAITHSVRGELSQALLILDEIIAKETNRDIRNQAQILAGVIYYNTGEYETAIERFNRVSSAQNVSPLILEQAYWYQANALMHLGRNDEATELLGKVIELDGAFSRVADRFLKNMIS